MRVIYFFIFTIHNVVPGILAQDIINLDLGELEFKAKAGALPAKYYPLSSHDEKATQRAVDVVDFIQLVPEIDPLTRPELPPVGIDLPFLWLTGAVITKNLVVSGVKSLQLKALELRLADLRTDLNVSIPKMYFEVDLKLQAKLSFVPLVFNCHVSANLIDLDVTISSGSTKAVQPGVGEVLQLTSAAVRLYMRNVQLNITNMLFGGSFEDLDRTRPTVNQIFSGNKDGNVFDTALAAALKFANQHLLTVPLELFESYLISDD